MAALVKAAGFDVETGPGSHLPDAVLDAVQRKLPDMMVRADDIARAVLYAVSQPIEVDVFEIAVRPSKQYPL